MVTKFNKTFFLLSLILILFLNCTREDSVDKVIDEYNFTAKVNGEDFRSNSEVNASIQITKIPTGNIEDYYLISLGGGDIISTGKVKAIVLAMAGHNFDQLSAGKTFDKVNDKNDTEGGIGAYSEDITNDENLETDIIESVFIKITVIDKDKKLISGEFNFVAIDEDKNKKYTVTNGQFKDIPYKLK